MRPTATFGLDDVVTTRPGTAGMDDEVVDDKTKRMGELDQLHMAELELAAVGVVHRLSQDPTVA